MRGREYESFEFLTIRLIEGWKIYMTAPRKALGTTVVSIAEGNVEALSFSLHKDEL